jgi:hypothetical protein
MFKKRLYYSIGPGSFAKGILERNLVCFETSNLTAD